MVAPPAAEGTRTPVIEVRLLGRFVVTGGGRSIATWPRPSARRLCQLVLVSPGRRVSRESACEALFPSLSPEPAARSLYRVQSLARQALKELGPEAAGLLCADPGQIWANPSVALAVDLDAHQEALQAALSASPGPGRDAALVEALSTGGTPLEDEPEAEWAAPVRERVQYLRQEARLELARDRLRGVGRAHPEEVLQAWQACLEADPADEEAAAALMRLYGAQGRRSLALAVYESCRVALAKLGLGTSPALEELRVNAEGDAPLRGHTSPLGADAGAGRRLQERRLVSVVSVELSPAGGLSAPADPEDLVERVGAGLAEAISEAELFGGTVASVSGSGMSVLFGAPQAHEDDPERALRSALRISAAVSHMPGSAANAAPIGTSPVALSARIGVETGPAVVGPIGGGGRVDYGAVGDVVGAATTLASVAKAASVLVGPATRAATEGIFEWGPNEDVVVTPGARPLVATYLVGPRPRSVAETGRRRLAAKAPLVGREAELAVMRQAVQATVAGNSGAVLVVGEPGLGKTRLVGECRKYFMAWAGAASGRLPLWLEGRCASYASSTPYGAYQQLLYRFVGASLEEGEAVLRPALDSAMHAVLGQDRQIVPVLARMMGLPPGPGGAHLGRMGPGELQQATFSAVRSLLSRLVERGPTVLCLEDLHWADPTSLRLTGALATLADDGPLLVLATRRPEPDPGVAELEAALGAGPAR
ncbi:MAG TPA: AAA family ATPase, partial [Acidimicrobiales bacterium]|nr:AAA family ATPase [Acidimicrobiales bacterium]